MTDSTPQIDDTQTTAPPPLTDAQRDILHRAANHSQLNPAEVASEDGDDYTYFGALGHNLTICRSLCELGLMAEHPRVLAFRLTDAGRAAIAPQPGDGLPPNGALADDLPSLAEMVREANVRQLQRFAEERDAALAERDLLAARLADAETSRNLARELNDMLKEKLVNEQVANAHLRDRLDAVRRDLAEANARLAQRQDDGALAELMARIEALEAVYDEPVPYALVSAETSPRKVEVKTLKQNLSGVSADSELAAELNDGWEVLHIGIDAGESWTRRIVTLTREIDDDDGSDGPEARASLDAETDATEPAPVTAEGLPGPLFSGNNATVYLNSLDAALAADAEANADGVRIERAVPVTFHLDRVPSY